MMRLLNNAKKDVKIDESLACASVWVTNTLVGSEDYLVSDKIFSLVGETMRSFRSDLIQKSPPNTIKRVITSILRPKSIKSGKKTEGSELFDGGEMEVEVAEDE